MHDRVSVNSLCFMGSTLDEQEGYWRDLAPRRISFMTPQVFEEGEDRARAIVEAGGYRVATVAHGFHMGPLGDEREIVEPARESLSRAIRFARSVEAESIYLVTGGRGRRSWEEAADCFSTAIAPCVVEAKEAGVPLLIETSPFTYAGVHLVHTLRDTVTLARLANIGVCIDLFAIWTEAGLRGIIESALPICHLVQVADYVCGDGSQASRAVPGDGDIPIPQIIEWIIEGGYTGSFDLELIGGRIDEEGRVEAIRRSAEFVSHVLEALGA